jgi:hypothetical protein
VFEALSVVDLVPPNLEGDKRLIGGYCVSPEHLMGSPKESPFVISKLKTATKQLTDALNQNPNYISL